MEKFFLTIKKYNLIETGDKIVVAVSGGPDSLALAHLLRQIAADWSLKLHIAHVNHMFRREAAEEMAFVQKTAQEWGLPVTAVNIDVPSYVAKSGLSPQEAAREMRYGFLEKLVFNLNFNKIALGHNADDQAETVVMNFLRGSGLKGLAGMPPMRENKFIRPLLQTTRREIEDYCRDQGLEPQEDLSNKQFKYLRNRVRGDLLPLLEKYNPNLKEVLGHTAVVLRAEEEYFGQETEELFKVLAEIKEDSVCIAAGKFGDLHPALQRRVVRKAWEKLLGPGETPPFQHVERILSLAKAQLPRRIQLPRGASAWLDQDQIKIGYLPELPATPSYCYRLPIPGRVDIFEIGAVLTAERVPFSKFLVIEDRDTVFVDASLIGEEARVRSRKPGDRFSPLGMTGSKKLKNFFIDEKTPRPWREAVPLVTVVSGDTGEDSIVWVAGYRIDNKWKISGPGSSMVKLSLKFSENLLQT